MAYSEEQDSARDRSAVEVELECIRQELHTLHDRAKYYIERTGLVLQPQTSKGMLAVDGSVERERAEGRPISELLSQLRDIRSMVNRVQETIGDAEVRLDL